MKPDGPLQAELERRWNLGAEGIPALTDWLLAEAARSGASDLHLEPREDEVLLRWRRDGCLSDAGVARGPLRVNLVQRIKVLAGLLTYRNDLPQDGRITGASIEGIADMRVSVYPAALGEKVVVRFFQAVARSGSGGTGEGADGKREIPALDALGLEPRDAARLANVLAQPQGLLLLTGPAGSGKTTTLYAALAHIIERARGQRQIVTIEDPVERILPGVTHTELKPASGLDYPAALKALLRQDPEAIMIGEIRDGETAQVAVQAALTGHLILSTVHAASAPEVLLRLLHLGVEPYLAASVVSAVLEQRLVRRLCDCKQAAAADGDGGGAGGAGVPARGSDGAPAGEPFRARGCEKCAGSGYRGRLLVAELLPVERAVRGAVLERKDSLGMMSAAASAGWRGLWPRGVEKVAAGLTSMAELRRVLVNIGSEF